MTLRIFDHTPFLQQRFLPDGQVSLDIKPAEVDPRKLRAPSSFPPFPDVFYPAIGAIVLGWSAFKNNHDGLLYALCRYNGTPADAIPRGFERRRKLFKSEVRKAFPQRDNILSHFLSCLGEAKILCRKRNILIHGDLSLKVTITPEIPPKKSGLLGVLSTEGFTGEERYEESFSIADLETLYYDIIHLSGKIREPYHKHSTIPGISLLERQDLMNFRDAVLGVGVPNT